MKVPADASYELVYSVSTHPQLGPAMEAYVVQLTSAGNLSLVHQKIHSNNAEVYDKKLDANDYKALKLLDECTPEFIVKKFSKVKRIRPSEFFKKQFTDSLFKNFIRPHIEKRLIKVMDLIRGKQVYLQQLKNVIYESVDWSDEKATVLFHLRRNEDNTHYFATVKHQNARVHISKTNAILLTERPCYLLSAGKILQFDANLDGQKILPFLSKSFIAIPRKSEEAFLRKFIAPLLEEHAVYAVGYEIISEQFKASPVIKLTQLLDGTYGVVLQFRYGDTLFPYHTGKMISVKVEKTKESYQFIRIRRSKQWEDIKKDTLLNLDVHHKGGAQFGWEQETDEFTVVNWTKRNRSELEAAGFTITQDLKTNYSLEEADISYQITKDHDWFDLKATVQFGEFSIPFLFLRKAIIAGQKTIRLKDDSYAIIPEKWIQQILGFEEFSGEEDHIRIDKKHAGLLADLDVQTLSRHKSILPEKISDLKDHPMPKGFVGELRSYQKSGYNWLMFLRENDFGGCLADDMGLGKTVQTLAFLQRIKEDSVYKPSKTKSITSPQLDLFGSKMESSTSLLVVPTSLLHNWYYEAKKFTPDIKILIHAGNGRTREMERFGYFDVVITTYGTVRNDLELFRNFPFEAIVLDESQFVKNPTSRVSKAVYELDGKTRLTLTGTPVENSITDLWSQMNFCNPGLLGGFNSFKRNYVGPIEKDFNADLTERLQKLINPFILRRTKMQVASDLPAKTEQIIYCDMSEDQEDIYEKTKSKYRNEILDSIQLNGMAKSKIQILSGLTKLRQMANHPVLSDPDYTGTSGKFEQVEQMLSTALEEGHQVLMFSQFVGHLGIYRKWLEERNIEYAYLDGGTSTKDRKNEVKKFQNNEVSLFLISLKAGGFGLNLTAADYVFLLDPWWNPAAESQATDRAHRIGQERKVFSYKFVTGNSVEEKIVRLQERKKNLSASLIKTESSFVKNIDIESLKEILT